MKVKMLTTQSGSQKGILVEGFEEGVEYDILPRLADIFLRHGWAEEVSNEVKAAPKVEDQDVPPVQKPEKKALASPAENKAEEKEVKKPLRRKRK